MEQKGINIYNEMKPFRFKPYLKTVIWGGDKIAPFKGIKTDKENIGESWEISGVPGHESVCTDRGLANDEDKGLTLFQLIGKYKERLLGKRVFEHFGPNFPLLVKIIDSKQDLSIQVHPNDQLAHRRHNCCGKTEMWYIIEAEQGAQIHVGLKKEITPEDYVRLATQEAGEGKNPFADIMANYESHPGDCFFLPAGRLHAIGGGNLLAEIQQTSDITYRVYDYGRKDADGHPRELHIEQAKEAIDYTVYPEYREVYDKTQASAELVSCPYFTVRREQIEGEQSIDYGCDSFVIALCLEGEAEINGISVRRGQTLLVPAEENTMHIAGHCTLLTATI